MKRWLFLIAVAMAALLATASSASARDLRCDDTFTGTTVKGDVIVPRGASCILINSTVTRSVEVRRDAYFQATGTTVRRNVVGRNAQTIFVDGASTVRGRLRGRATSQVFLFDSTVRRLKSSPMTAGASSNRVK